MSLRSMDDRRILTLRSFTAVALAAALIASSSAFVATDLSLPFSKAVRISRSHASTFGIGTTFLLVPCRLAARNNGLVGISLIYTANKCRLFYSHIHQKYLTFEQRQLSSSYADPPRTLFCRETAENRNGPKP